LLTDVSFDEFKMYLLLYADDVILMTGSEQGIQQTLYSLTGYCDKWKLAINKNKQKKPKSWCLQKLTS